MSIGKTTPVLRIFDEEKALAFFVNYLGFTVDWEYRAEPEFPVYMQVSRDACSLQLSGHHGDCSPGASLRIDTSGLESFHAELAAKSYKFANPGIELTPWGTRDMTVIDPFGNKLTFTTVVNS